jgi:predicted dehydrogenase
MVHGADGSAEGCLRIGMVGGGPGAFIGAVHRIALAMDGRFRLVAGAFSSSSQKSNQMGSDLGLDPRRVYDSYTHMAESEVELPEDQRIDAVAIVTPNHMHYPIAKRFLQKGFHVVCDKPLTLRLEEAEELAQLAENSSRLFCVTHTYTGYPMVNEARELVAAGAIGDVRKVYVEYLQGWLADKLEDSGQKQAAWRTDPAKSGPCGAMGDIGTHAANLAEFITGQSIGSLYSVLHTFVDGRALDDDGMVLLKFTGGATGTLCASQVCVGRENGLRIRVFGTQGGLDWDQEYPNDLTVYHKDRAPELRRPGNGWVGEGAASRTRVPAGHPEGYHEAFAILYRNFAAAIHGEEQPAHAYPTVQDGVRGMRFLSAVVRSNQEEAWVEV